AFKKKHNGLLLTEKFNKQKIFLLKPLTYMNNSGQAVRTVLNYYNIPPANTIVLVDDYALGFGRLRVRAKGSDGGHNGLKSIASHLGSAAYIRLRLGIYAPGRQNRRDFVLSSFTREERKKLDEFLHTAAAALTCILTNGVTSTMNRYNTKKSGSNEHA
ncbi:MAG TPA: aminoacyl-tRNA hydrolase, partial [Spirochaetota bacterium]|nr:aminoacyl-tRNA hydrolase [Spirochaetota bacterium]